MSRYDAIVVGGGFYGCRVALKLAQLGLRRVLLAERESCLLGRSSYINQARVHNGYHYPRSIPTAQASQINFSRFCEDFSFAVVSDFEKYYAIARGSMVNASQFERFCAMIKAPCTPAWASVGQLFDDRRIEQVFRVQEYAFNAIALRDHLHTQLNASPVEVRLQSTVRLERALPDHLRVRVGDEMVEASYLLNCTYARLDEVDAGLPARVKRELTEMLLIQPPPELQGLGVTVMDGPFFSMMPFPAEQCMTLSHVRYTPHGFWYRPQDALEAPHSSNGQAMIRDAARYMPAIAACRVVRPVFEIKAVLARNELDDGRPILFERSQTSSRIISILGAKIDNIYDVEAILPTLAWTL